MVYGDISNNCCGLGEIGGFESHITKEAIRQRETSLIKSGARAIIATTIPTQKAATAALKAAGFKALKRFNTNHVRKHPYKITLWYKTYSLKEANKIDKAGTWVPDEGYF